MYVLAKFGIPPSKIIKVPFIKHMVKSFQTTCAYPADVLKIRENFKFEIFGKDVSPNKGGGLAGFEKNLCYPFKLTDAQLSRSQSQTQLTK